MTCITVTNDRAFVPFVVVIFLSSFFLSFITSNHIFNKSNTTSWSGGAGTADNSWAPEFTPLFSGVRVIGFCIVFCRSLPSFSSIVLSVLRVTVTGYPFGILQTFIWVNGNVKNQLKRTLHRITNLVEQYHWNAESTQ